MTTSLRSMFAVGALAWAMLAAPQAWSAAPADSGRPVVYEGTVSVVVEDDFARGRATKRFFLDEQNLGERLELKVNEAQGKALRTGAKIRVRGRAAGGTLSADALAESVTVLAEPAAAAPLAARKVLVMLVDLKDGNGSSLGSVSADCDGASKSSTIMFGDAAGTLNVDGCYKDSSYGALGMGGAVYPGGATDVVRVSVTEPATSLTGVCNYTSWGSNADKAAALAGVTLANYQHRVYVVPSNVGCTWAGLAYVGCGNSCQAWVKAYSGQPCGYSDAYAHEIGHNLGMWHASTDTNNDGTLDCEYCDTSDFMGYALPNLRTQNGANKVMMGWASGARVVDGSQGGTFTISSLGLASAPFPQVVKVRPNSGDPYYLSFRTAVGYDRSMPSASTYLDKTSIHRWSSGNTRFIGSLGDGAAYSDPATGVSVRQVSRTADSVTVEVSTVCAVQPPTISISPASQGAGAALPATRSYTVSLTNRDSATCGNATFALARTLPPGWTGALSPSTITLASGATGTTTLSVTTPETVAAASYPLSVSTVADASHAAVTASASFWIDPVAPDAPTGLKATVKANRVTLSWTAAADNSGGSGIARYQVRRGTTLVGTPVSTTYTDSPGSGTWTYTVTAVDGAGNVSAPSAALTVKAGRK